MKIVNGQLRQISFQDVIIDNLIAIHDGITQNLGTDPGTTFAAAIIRKKGERSIVTSASIGDSKILKIGANGEVKQLVKDDNILYDGIQKQCLYVLDNDKNNIYSSDPSFVFAGDSSTKRISYRPTSESNSRVQYLKEGDERFYRANNVIRECLGCGKNRLGLIRELCTNMNDFISEDEFKPGEKLFLCSDGIGDNFSNQDIGDIFYTGKESRECLKELVNRVYEIQRERNQYGRNNPNSYLEGHQEFRPFMKGASDNISGVIVEHKGGER